MKKEAICLSFQSFSPLSTTRSQSYGHEYVSLDLSSEGSGRNKRNRRREGVSKKLSVAISTTMERRMVPKIFPSLKKLPRS